MAELLLQARDITVRFGGLSAVDAVSADFNGGELVGIIAPAVPARRRFLTRSQA